MKKNIKKKRVLIISPDSRHFVQNYINNVLAGGDFEILFLSMNADRDDPTWKENSVKVYNLKEDANEATFLTILKAPFKLLYFRKQIGKMDIIHYHYIDYRFTRLTDFFMRRRSARTIMTFWGSDLLKATGRQINAFRNIYKRSYAINVMSKEMLDTFTEMTGGKYNDKAIILDFGNSTIEKIALELTPKYRIETKKAYNLPKDKVIVHVGYNGAIAQQHIKVAEVLEKLSKTLKEKIYVVIPFGYGCVNDEYYREVNEAFLNTGIDFRIDTKYLSQEEVIAYRPTADIFLYAQETDAISSSVLEYLCAGAYVIKPIWLDYSEYTKNGVKMRDFCEFKDIKDILEKVISNKEYGLLNVDNNRKFIISHKSWQVLKREWLKLYS